MNKRSKRQIDLRHEALSFTQFLAEQYFVQRRLDTLTQYMDGKVSWIGTGDGEISQNINEAKEALAKELLEYSGSFRIKQQWFEAVPYNDKLCIVYGAIKAEPVDPAFAKDNLRISLMLKKTAQGMKLFHLHLSHPDMDQEQGRYYVPEAARSNTLNLRRQLDILNHNIPGGAHQCKNNPNLTIISMSDSFLSMFGYTSEEITTLFHNNFIEMVYPGDRAALLSAAYEQLKRGRDIELEYRVLRKDGTPVWVLDQGRLSEDGNGGESFYCLLMDITGRRQVQEELRLTLERHQVIMDQATDIIFEWDIRQDTLLFSQNWYKKFGYSAIDTQISGRIPLSRNIHPEDMQAFVKIMKDTAAGVPYSETEFRIKDIKGTYYWCRIRATTQFDSDNRAVKAVGVIVDIEGEKKQKQILLDMAQKDALTGLYNKATINALVEQRMKDCGSCVRQALLILDVDHFKDVNDTYGHLIGDNILSDVAAVIKTQIRSTDLAGRIGGDEFLIFLAKMTDETVVAAKAAKLLAAFGAITPEPGAAPISCSIGVVVFSDVGTDMDYQALYQRADQALYAQKNNGRGGVTFYRADMGCQSSDDVPKSAVGADVGSDDDNVGDEQLSQYAFRILYTARDIESTINSLLEILGRSYDVSRAYVFESSADRKFCSNTFEWCAAGVEPQIAILQNLSYKDDLNDYLKNFDKKGLFYCPNVQKASPDLRSVLAPQGIQSMLQCAMLDEREFVGYVGFDECRENREWTAQQIASFKLTADVLSTFIVKLRQKQRIKKRQLSKLGEGGQK